MSQATLHFVDYSLISPISQWDSRLLHNVANTYKQYSYSCDSPPLISCQHHGNPLWIILPYLPLCPSSHPVTHTALSQQEPLCFCSAAVICSRKLMLCVMLLLLLTEVCFGEEQGQNKVRESFTVTWLLYFGMRSGCWGIQIEFSMLSEAQIFEAFTSII